MEGHDFAVPCDSRISVRRGGQVIDLQVCENSASWWARLLCCDRVIFSCDPHKLVHYSLCSVCLSGIDRPGLMWLKI